MYSAAEIAERIKATARMKNMTYTDVLVQCRLSKNLIISMANGGSVPKSENLAKIADVLDVSVDYLLGRTDCPDNPANSDENIIIENLDSTSIQVAEIFQELDIMDKTKALNFIIQLYEKS